MKRTDFGHEIQYTFEPYECRGYKYKRTFKLKLFNFLFGDLLKFLNENIEEITFAKEKELKE